MSTWFSERGLGAAAPVGVVLVGAPAGTVRGRPDRTALDTDGHAPVLPGPRRRDTGPHRCR